MKEAAVPKPNEDQIVERLDNLIRLVALGITASKTKTEGIRLLKLAGLDTRTIADVLELKPTVVRTIASTLRRKRSTQLQKGAENE